MSDEIGATDSAAGSSPAPSTASTDASSASTAQPSATATAAPVTTSVPAPDSGEPPKERWADILDNTRKKTRGEVEAEIRSQYGWADEFQNDPMTFLEKRFATHPQYAAQFTAFAARHLSGRRGQQATVAEKPKPDVPVTDGHGTITGYVYSDKQQDALDEWKWTAREAALNEKFAPLESMRQQIEQAQQIAQIEHQSQEHAKTTLEGLRQNPYFKEHEAKVKAALIAHEEFGDNVHAAFNFVLTNEILPSLSQTEQRKVVESLQQKAAGATVNPGGSAAASRPKFKDLGEAMRYYADHPDEAAAMANR